MFSEQKMWDEKLFCDAKDHFVRSTQQSLLHKPAKDKEMPQFYTGHKEQIIRTLTCDKSKSALYMHDTGIHLGFF